MDRQANRGTRPATNATRVAPPSLTDAERTKLEQRRDRLMALLREGGDAEDQADLTQEWNQIDNQLNRR